MYRGAAAALGLAILPLLGAADSARLFHAPHDVHRPTHFVEVAEHSLQMNIAVFLRVI